MQYRENRSSRILIFVLVLDSPICDLYSDVFNLVSHRKTYSSSHFISFHLAPYQSLNCACLSLFTALVSSEDIQISIKRSTTTRSLDRSIAKWEFKTHNYTYDCCLIRIFKVQMHTKIHNPTFSWIFRPKMSLITSF